MGERGVLNLGKVIQKSLKIFVCGKCRKFFAVFRRIGGLEKEYVCILPLDKVFRRIGGLEPMIKKYCSIDKFIDLLMGFIHTVSRKGTFFARSQDPGASGFTCDWGSGKADVGIGRRS